MRASKGITLLELILTLSIVGVLGTLAIPTLGNLYHDAGRVATVNEFVHALALARSEAVMRSDMVSLCKSADGNSCMNRAPDWNIGWIVFANTDGDEPPVRDANEPLLQVYAGWRNGHITSNRNSYSFRPYTQGVLNGTVVFCDPRGSAWARALILNHAGRPRVAQRDSANKPLRCPAG